MKQFVLALDQTLSTLVPPYKGAHRGWADETLSARAWRCSSRSRAWGVTRSVIDWIFLALLNQQAHCFESWVSERLRLHMPPELRTESNEGDKQ